ncbi:DNA methyltransferase, partial [Streptomyces olivaceus]
TVLALLGEVRADCARFTGTPVPAENTAAELRVAGVLPVPSAARRPASVLDTPEEGPEGQLALL